MKRRIPIEGWRERAWILTVPMLLLMILLIGIIIAGISEASTVPINAYDSRYDLNHDGHIDVSDIQSVAGHWGATGDWTGNCSMIQDAINALPTEGGQVIIQAGVYTCDEPILIDRDNVDLRGQGSATMLYLADQANSPVIVLGGTGENPPIVRSNIQVSDLAIYGNRHNQAFECWGGPCDSGGLTYIRNNGITLRRVSDVLIERITVASAASAGLVTERGCERVAVRDFTATDSEYDGLAAYQTENSVFTGLHLYDNPYAGLSFDWSFNNNVISDAIITNNGTVGIFMIDSRDNELNGIQIGDSGDHGIFLAQRNGDPTSPASGNTFSGVVVSNSTGAGIRVNDSSVTNTLVVGSQFIGNSAGCISEADFGQVVVSGTICR